MTYGDRPGYWPASAGYFDAPLARGVDQMLMVYNAPVELWGDLPGTPAYPLPREFVEAGQVALVQGAPPPEFGATDPGVIFEDVPEAPPYTIPGLEWAGRTVLPPMVITPGEGPLPPYPGMAVPGLPTVPPPLQHLPIPGQPPPPPAVPPPTTIPTTPVEPKKPIHVGWIIGGVGLALVAGGAIIYLATKKTPRRNPRRRRRSNPRRRRARRRNPYAADAQGTIHFFPSETSQTRWLARAPSRKSHRVKGSTRRVRKAKGRGTVVRHRNKAKSKKRKARNPLTERQRDKAARRVEAAWSHDPFVQSVYGMRAASLDAMQALQEAGVAVGTPTYDRFHDPDVIERKLRNPRCPKSTRVQTLVFSRDSFDPRAARAWAKAHGYRYGKIDQTDKTMRVRQESPRHFTKGGFRTIPLAPGVLGVIGCPR